MTPSLAPTAISTEEPAEWYNRQKVMNLRPFALPGLCKVE
jgi:hypothetical protein